MKTLYIECSMGAAGDMLSAALLELLPEKDSFIGRINSLSLPGVAVSYEPSVKCGITGTRYVVSVGGREEESLDISPDTPGSGGASRVRVLQSPDHRHTHSEPGSHHSHSGLDDISRLVSGLNLSKKVKSDVMAVYSLIAEAEAKAHGREIDQVHFHEVGQLDAVADIISFCLLMEIISPDRVVVSPVHVGSGMVRCAHGILPVPAPATAHILRNLPMYGGMIKGELCTPTGAALLVHFAGECGPMPVLVGSKIGYGMGKKDFEAANCVRAFLGETAVAASGPNGSIAELCCNLDDMTGEQIGFAMETLLEAGALDVFNIPIIMKKSRPGQLFTCICRAEEADKMAALILKHTTTFGLRRKLLDRYTLEREISDGPVRVKTGRGYGVEKSKKEYEDLAKLARRSGKSLFELD